MITIDLKHRSYAPSLYSRLLWQKLFNIYHEHSGNLTALDSFLCDLHLFESWFNQHKAGIIYWSVDFESGYTDLSTYPQHHLYCVKIAYYQSECIDLFFPNIEEESDDNPREMSNACRD